MREEVFEHLERLRHKISLAKPIRTGPLKGRMGYEFRISRSPLSELITAVFLFYQDEVHIGISGFVRSKGDPPTSLAPAEWLDE